MSRRGQVYLAEFLEVLDTLSPRDPETQEALLAMLHLGRQEALRDTQRPPGPSQLPSRLPLPPPRPAVPPAVPPPAGASDAQPLRDTELIRVRRASPSEPPAWSRVGDQLLPEPAPVPLPVPSLIEPRKRTAILSAALSTQVAEGRPLLEPVLRAIACAVPVTELPRRNRPTLRRGVQVLVDQGDGMIPFDADVRGLLEALRRSVGQGRTEVLYFTGSPLRGVSANAPDEAGPWRPPRRGTPLLVLTDLGLGGPAVSPHRAYAAEWARFAGSAHDAGCPPVVLVPYRRERWPRSLRQHLQLVHWDRGTTAGGVRQRVGARPRGARR